MYAYKRVHLQDKLVRQEARLATAIEGLNAEEMKLLEKQQELDEVQAAYNVLMEQRKVSLRMRLLAIVSTSTCV